MRVAYIVTKMSTLITNSTFSLNTGVSKKDWSLDTYLPTAL